MSFLQDLQDPNRIAVVDREGKVGTIDKSEEALATQLGYLPASEEQIQKKKDEIEYGSTANAALAGLAGAARGVSFGLSDVALTRTGAVEKETLSKLQEYQPAASITGEIVGAALPLLVSGGGSAPASGAGLAKTGLAVGKTAVKTLGVMPRAAAKVGQLTERLGNKALFTEGLEASFRDQLIRAIPKSAGSAVEGAFYGGGQLVSEAALGKKEINAENIIGSVGLGGLFGAAVPMVVGSAGLLATPLQRKATDSLNRFAKRVGELTIEPLAGATRIAADEASEAAAAASAGAALAMTGAAPAQAIAGAVGGAIAGKIVPGVAKKVLPQVTKSETAKKMSARVFSGFSEITSGLSSETIQKGITKFGTPEGAAIRNRLLMSDLELKEYSESFAKSLQETTDDMSKLRNELNDNIAKEKADAALKRLTPAQRQALKTQAEDAGESLEDWLSNEPVRFAPDAHVGKTSFERGKWYVTGSVPGDIMNDLFYNRIPSLERLATDTANSEYNAIISKLKTQITDDTNRFVSKLSDLHSKQFWAESATQSSIKETGAKIGKKILEKGEKPLENLEDQALDLLFDAVGIPRALAPAVKSQVHKLTRNLNKNFGELLVEMSKNNPTLSENFARRMRNHIEHAEKKLSKVASADTTLIKNARDTLQNHLSDDALYGKTAAQYRALYKAVYPHLDLSEKLSMQFGSADGIIDVEKVRRFLFNIQRDDATTIEQARLLKDYIETSAILIKESASRVTINPNMTSKEFIDTISDIKNRNELKAFKNRNPLMQELLYLAGMHYLLGPVGTVLTAGSRIVSNPALAIKALAIIESMVLKHKKGVAGKIHSFITVASAKAKQAADTAHKVERMPTTSVGVNILQEVRFGPEKDKTNQDRRTAFLKRSKEISELVSNPQVAIDRLAGTTQGLSTFAPGISEQLGLKAMQSLQFLYDKMPKNPNAGTPFANKWVPSDSEISRWAKYVAAVENPMSVIESMSRGQLSKEGVEVLQNCYPELYEEVKAALIEKTAEIEKMPYLHRTQLSLLFGTPFEPSMRPENLMILHASQNSEQQQTPATKALKLKVHQTELDRIIDS